MKNVRFLDTRQVLRFMQERGLHSGFERLSATDYDMDNALEVVTAIGKARNPRFVIDSDNRFAYENFIKWCHADPTMQAIDPLAPRSDKNLLVSPEKRAIRGDLNKGIYLAGGTGTGKSWSLEIMLTYAQVWGFEVRFLDKVEPTPLYWSISRADDICREYANGGEIYSFKQRRIIGIQDLGQEPKETLYMGNRLNVLGQLIEYRGDQDDQLTLITSNLHPAGEGLRGLYGDRVQSRLIEMCNYLEITGKDRRKGI